MSELKDKADNKKTIENAAIKVFAIKGIHGASMQDISKEAGLSIGTIYHYFKSKEELCEDIFATKQNKFREGLYKELLKTDDFFEKLRIWILYIIDFFKSEEHYNKIFAIQLPVLVFATENKSDFMTSLYMELTNEFADFIKEGIEKKLIHYSGSPETFAFLFKGLISKFLLKTLILDATYNPQEADAMIEFILNGIKQ
jgi:AcrR family transcriptional regulator